MNGRRIVSETGFAPIHLQGIDGMRPAAPLLRVPASSFFRRFRLPLTSLLLLLIYVAIYPRQIELSGDQTAQVVAAESLLRDGTYKVPLHEAYGPEKVVEVGADLRQPLRWYPPGYSLALRGLAGLGLSLAGAALLLFYLSKFVFALSWLAVGRAYQIPWWLITLSLACASLLTYPSTTTEIFESISVALFFLALSPPMTGPAGACFASASIGVGTLFRFAAVKLLAFYALAEWIRQPRLAAFVRVALVSIFPLSLYMFITRFIGGEATPYHGVGPGPHTRWVLLVKGLYYAATGGWSPSTLWLRVLLMGVIVLAAAGGFRLLKKGPLPPWIVLTVAFEAYSILFLIATQVMYGSMYSEMQPAFATPRLFSLAAPLNIAALLFLAPLAVPAASYVTRRIAASIVVFCVLAWVVQNWQIMAGMSKGADGFLRFGDLAAVHRALQSAPLDGIFDGTGVVIYTAVDPRIIYPDDVRGIRSGSGARIAVVRLAADSNNLQNELRRFMHPNRVQRFDRFEVEWFTLDPGFEITLKPRAGFVPHL